MNTPAPADLAPALASTAAWVLIRAVAREALRGALSHLVEQREAAVRQCDLGMVREIDAQLGRLTAACRLADTWQPTRGVEHVPAAFLDREQRARLKGVL